MSDGLFETETPTTPDPPVSEMMTGQQRASIREAFERLGIADASSQFSLVHELTGVRISSVANLTAAQANTLMKMLAARVTHAGKSHTGNSWDDRDEDTWIDRL